MKALLVALSMVVVTIPVLADEAPIPVEIRNARITDEGILTGGQPTVAQLTALKKAGYKTIINLRPETEVEIAFEKTKDETLHYDERTAALKAGFQYISLPIGSAEDLTADNARALDQMLKNLGDGVILHCGSGNRVGALMALRAFHIQNKSSQEALELGRAAGLTKLEPVISELLSPSN